MRFTKRNRGPLSWARRAKRTPQDDDEFVPVDSEERSALLGLETSPPSAPAAAGGHSGPTSDPGRQLLTVLGRLQRQVTRASEGDNPDAWADPCMNLLIDAVEIALQQNWDDLADSLTETGRVLNSYEDAGRTAECVGFLADSCGIFCLLATNPVQGPTWDSMLTRWRQRYDAALAELDSAGIRLIRDDEEVGEVSPGQDGPERRAESSEVPFEMPPMDEEDDADTTVSGDASAPSDGLPSLDDLPSLEEAIAVTSEFREEESAAEEDEAGSDGDSTPDFQEIPPSQELPDLEELEPLEPLREAEAPREGNGGLSAEVVEILDTLCDGLSRIEQKGASDLRTTTLAMEEGLVLLREAATADGRLGAVSACETMQRMLEVLGDSPVSVGDRFLDLAYGFCGVYADAKESRDDPAIQTWIRDCEVFIETCTGEGGTDALRQLDAPPPEESMSELGASESQEQPEEAADEGQPPESPADSEAAAGDPFPEVPEVSSGDGSAQSLLEDAQHAVAQGRSDAELLALRAAASIARAKAERSEAQVKETEGALQEAVGNIDRARGGVGRAEQEVANAEAAVADAEKGVGEGKEEVKDVKERLDGLDEEVQGLDDQIRKLQEERATKDQQRSEARNLLAEKEQGLAQSERQAEAMKQAENAAREELENARQRVKHGEQKRGEVEAAMSRAREVLTRQREALADIEQMIERLGVSGADDGEDSLLFDL